MDEGYVASPIETAVTVAQQVMEVATATASAQVAVAVLQTALGAVQAQFTVKLNANGHIAGIGLMTSSTTSEMVVLADQFKVVNPSLPSNIAQVFTVGQIGGQGAVGINGNLALDGSILARTIAAGQITATQVGSNQIITSAANIADAVITNAKIGNLEVDTIKIKDQAVTSVVNSYASGSLAIISTSTNCSSAVLGVAYTAYGAACLVTFAGISRAYGIQSSSWASISMGCGILRSGSAAASTDLISAPLHGMSTGWQVLFVSAPAGVDVSRTYYVRDVDSLSFRLCSTTPGSTALNIVIDGNVTFIVINNATPLINGNLNLREGEPLACSFTGKADLTNSTWYAFILSTYNSLTSFAFENRSLTIMEVKK